MDYSTLLVGALSLTVGTGIAAVVTVFICRGNSAAVEGALRSERDVALGSLKDREASIVALNASLNDANQKVDTANAAVSQLRGEKGRLEGEQASLDDIRRQIDGRNERIDNLNRIVLSLESAKAELEATNAAIERSKAEAIFAMESRMKALIAEKEQHLNETLEANAHNFRKLTAEIERSCANQIAMAEANLADKKKLLDDAEKILIDKFSTVSLESLKSASGEFLKLADERLKKVGELSAADLEKRQTAINELVKPVAETLEKLNLQTVEMEAKRLSAFDAIEKGIKNLSADTDQLANALRKPTSRGAWGEMNLQVILEHAGLIAGEHFHMQDSTDDDEDGRLRTDVVVHLPSGRDLIIDSKAPLESFWEGMNAPDEATRAVKFAAHARLVREHVKSLSSKKYWSRYKNSPDCVVMFIPTEGAYQAAIEADRTLLSDAQNARVYLANPMSLVNLIHLTAYILKEDRLKQNTQAVQAAGAELYERLRSLIQSIESVGKSLTVAVNHYNKAIGTLDRRVLPSARKIHAMGGGSGSSIVEIAEIEVMPRTILSPELREPLAPELPLLELDSYIEIEEP